MEFADTEVESTVDEFARDGEMVTLVILAKLKKGLLVGDAVLIFSYLSIIKNIWPLLYWLLESKHFLKWLNKSNYLPMNGRSLL